MDSEEEDTTERNSSSSDPEAIPRGIPTRLLRDLGSEGTILIGLLDEQVVPLHHHINDRDEPPSGIRMLESNQEPLHGMSADEPIKNTALSEEAGPSGKMSNEDDSPGERPVKRSKQDHHTDESPFAIQTESGSHGESSSMMPSNLTGSSPRKRPRSDQRANYSLSLNTAATCSSLLASCDDASNQSSKGNLRQNDKIYRQILAYRGAASPAVDPPSPFSFSSDEHHAPLSQLDHMERLKRSYRQKNLLESGDDDSDESSDLSGNSSIRLILDSDTESMLHDIAENMESLGLFTSTPRGDFLSKTRNARAKYVRPSQELLPGTSSEPTRKTGEKSGLQDLPPDPSERPDKRIKHDFEMSTDNLMEAKMESWPNEKSSLGPMPSNLIAGPEGAVRISKMRTLPYPVRNVVVPSSDQPSTSASGFSCQASSHVDAVAGNAGPSNETFRRSLAFNATGHCSKMEDARDTCKVDELIPPIGRSGHCVVCERHYDRISEHVEEHQNEFPLYYSRQAEGNIVAPRGTISSIELAVCVCCHKVIYVGRLETHACGLFHSSGDSLHENKPFFCLMCQKLFLNQTHFYSHALEFHLYRPFFPRSYTTMSLQGILTLMPRHSDIRSELQPCCSQSTESRVLTFKNRPRCCGTLPQNK